MHYNGLRYIHATVVQVDQSLNAPFAGFHKRKQMPHRPSFGMGHQSIFSFMVITHRYKHTALTVSNLTVREVALCWIRYTHCRIVHKFTLKTSINLLKYHYYEI